MTKRKRYARCWDPQMGRSILAHRKVAEEMLGRPLLPGEIVHHRDGDSLNNACANLLVLPDQRHHAHFEYHLRCEKRGQLLLFPELLQIFREKRRGTLFKSILPS